MGGIINTMNDRLDRTQMREELSIAARHHIARRDEVLGRIFAELWAGAADTETPERLAAACFHDWAAGRADAARKRVDEEKYPADAYAALVEFRNVVSHGLGGVTFKKHRAEAMERMLVAFCPTVVSAPPPREVETVSRGYAGFVVPGSLASLQQIAESYGCALVDNEGSRPGHVRLRLASVEAHRSFRVMEVLGSALAIHASLDVEWMEVRDAIEVATGRGLDSVGKLFGLYRFPAPGPNEKAEPDGMFRDRMRVMNRRG